jgi:metallo-beta-lactamase class B
MIKKSVQAIFLLAFSLTSFGQLKISKVTSTLFVYTTYHEFSGTMFPSNGMYAVTKAGVVLIDSPWDVSQSQPLLDSIKKRHNLPVALCISTHYHDDSSGALDFLNEKGIPTWSSKLTYELSKEFGTPKAAFIFSKDTTFNIGGVKIETYYPGEGHTKDNIIVWFPKDRLIFGGCLVKSTENQSLGNIADANLEAWPQTMRNAIAKYPKRKYVVPGHFGWESNMGLEWTLELLLRQP